MKKKSMNVNASAISLPTVKNAMPRIAVNLAHQVLNDGDNKPIYESRYILLTASCGNSVVNVPLPVDSAKELAEKLTDYVAEVFRSQNDPMLPF